MINIEDEILDRIITLEKKITELEIRIMDKELDQ